MRFSIRSLCYSFSEAGEKHVSTWLMFFQWTIPSSKLINILNVVTTFELNQSAWNTVSIHTSLNYSFLFLTLTFRHSGMMLWLDLQSELILPTLTQGHVDSLCLKHEQGHTVDSFIIFFLIDSINFKHFKVLLAFAGYCWLSGSQFEGLLQIFAI